ncbi:MAG: hypothetical protein H0U81_09540, partial [Pyrinomonadaceae bacterium]|nr:hypothetical protein [Pyrinomonadaceae bacterium]
MERWKKVVAVIIGLAALSQFPFIYRRYQLGQLQSTIDMLNAGRVATDSDDIYADHKGVMHVHSHLGGHSTGAFEEIVAGAKSNKLA